MKLEEVSAGIERPERQVKAALKNVSWVSTRQR